MAKAQYKATPATKARVAPVATPAKSRVAVTSEVSNDGTQGRAISGASPVDTSKEPTVEVTVPKAFRLTDDGHVEHKYEAGVQVMPKSHADHAYTRANGAHYPGMKPLKAE